ncbi:uncharacterized protein LOC127252855 isoform X2 [Andrographis paniculata]|uniref:uncharacterized protein LOC127252855 isoform X2 n=1 Tax=Andrographis paniculata TaxID=175694 RepID=UPI0021E97DF3|nr:uncharacterized protein LOC127252855 isoform X2 [Andrographis paniculata]
MSVRMKIGSSFPSASAPPSSSPFRPKLISKVSWLGISEHSRNTTAVKSFQLKHRKRMVNERLSRKQGILFATLGDQDLRQNIEPEESEEQELQDSSEDATPTAVSDNSIEVAQGKPGFISFYGHSKKIEDQILVPVPKKNKYYVVWFVGPTILVSSFVFPSLYLRRILSTIFEDSLLTDFLILFFTEALFYCGVAVFLFLIDRRQRPMRQATAGTVPNLAPRLGDRISSGAILLLSLIIPTVTMGFVWPWTGPAASATLAPYLVGIVVQFAFEQFARRIRSPSLAAIPIIFQVYRLHQLNRAAQLVTALSFTIRGAEMTSHNMAINGSLTTLLNVLQFLGIVCVWSLSSFIMRYFSSAGSPDAIR